MELPKRKPTRLKGYDYSQNGAYFITICVKDRKPITVTTGLDDGHAPARRAYEKAGFEKNLPSLTYYKKL